MVALNPSHKNKVKIVSVKRRWVSGIGFVYPNKTYTVTDSQLTLLSASGARYDVVREKPAPVDSPVLKVAAPAPEEITEPTEPLLDPVDTSVPDSEIIEPEAGETSTVDTEAPKEPIIEEEKKPETIVAAQPIRNNRNTPKK